MNLQQPQHLKNSSKIVKDIILFLGFAARDWLDDEVKSRFLRIKAIVLESFLMLCVIGWLVALSSITFDLADIAYHVIMI